MKNILDNCIEKINNFLNDNLINYPELFKEINEYNINITKLYNDFNTIYNNIYF